MSCAIRPRFPTPAPPDGRRAAASKVRADEITLRHPGYDGLTNIMLQFPALDPFPPSSTESFGFHHETARVACAIVAKCRWDGFLSKEKKRGATPVQLGPDDLLPAGDYYFHVPQLPNTDASDIYPTFPSFANFEFPVNLPRSWTLECPQNPPQQLLLDKAVLERDGSCRITNYTQGTETAHIVPRAEAAWFYRELVARAANSMDDTRNAMLLRSDLHKLFNQRRFAVVPKNGSWVVHVLDGLPSGELADIYHNVELQPLLGLSVECMFARFAWTVLAQAPLSQVTFLQADVQSNINFAPGNGGIQIGYNYGGISGIIFPLKR